MSDPSTGSVMKLPEIPEPSYLGSLTAYTETTVQHHAPCVSECGVCYPQDVKS